MEHSKNTIITIVVLAVVIGGLVFAIVNFGGSDSDSVTQSPTEQTDTRSQSQNRITITDQQPGNIVFVSSATFAEGGFVVIYTDENGSLGANIGSRYFRDGTNPGDVEVTESLVVGRKYYAVLHRDNGNRTFEPQTDTAYTDGEGKVISVTFSVVEVLPEQKL